MTTDAELIREHNRRLQAERIAREVERLSASQPTPSEAHGVTATRERKARGDVRDEKVVRENGATQQRSRARAPLWIGVIEPQHPGEPERKPTGALDAVLTKDEATALARFVYGSFIGEGRVPSSNYSGTSTSSDPARRSLFTAREQAFIAARQHVWKRVPETCRRDLQLLTMWIAGGGKAPIDPTEWGKRYGGTTDPRVASGIFKGSFKRLAELVADILFEYDIAQDRKRAEARHAEERRRLLLGNSMDPVE